MPSDDDFNSSDFECEAPPLNPSAQAGKQSIQTIVENAQKGRFSSKKVTKQLAYVKGSKKTRYGNSLWYQRLQAFREYTLKVS